MVSIVLLVDRFQMLKQRLFHRYMQTYSVWQDSMKNSVLYHQLRHSIIVTVDRSVLNRTKMFSLSNLRVYFSLK